MAQLEALGAGAGGEAGRAARAAPQLQRREIRPYLLLAVKELSGNPDSRTSSVASTERYACVRAVVRHFARMRSAVTGGWSGEDVKVFLEGLRFTPECVAELTPLLCSEEVYANLPTHRYAQPQLVSMQWKIDISLCQVNLSTDERRGDETSTKQLLHRDTFVILIFTLADGTTRAYRMGIRKFHEIRFALATALKNMLVLERRKCMRSDGHS